MPVNGEYSQGYHKDRHDASFLKKTSRLEGQSGIQYICCCRLGIAKP